MDIDGEGGGFDDLVPRWMFVVSNPLGRVGVAAAVTALTTAPLWLNSDPASVRLAPLLVLGLVAVAGTAGWWATALSSLVVVPWYWWANVPPTSSFALPSSGEAVSVVAMGLLAIGLVALTYTVERSVADVKRLDQHRQLDHLVASVAKLDAEIHAVHVQAALRLSNQLAAVGEPAALAAFALAELTVPVPPTSSSIAIVEAGRLKILAAHNADPRSLRVLEQVDLADTDWLTTVLDGDPAFVDDRDAFALEHPNAGVLRLYASGSWAAIPFRSEGTVGLLSVHYADPQRLTAHTVYFSLVAEILATALQRAASEQTRVLHLAQLERTLAELAQSLAERDRIARTLSTTLLPPRLPALPGFATAAWLVPASADEVAGDFYDLFALEGGGWVAVLGDVCGKGAEAAAVTSLARYASRVTALDDPDPAHIADVANNALALDPSDLFCTMAVVRYMVDQQRLHVTLAGHPQPRLLHDGELCRIGEFGPALGLGTRDHRTTSYPFGPGDSVVLFSDGLIERDRAFGEDELDGRLRGMSGAHAPEISDAIRDLVAELQPDRADDLAVLVVSRTA